MQNFLTSNPFLRFLNNSGITLTELSFAKDVATNWVQQIRLPYMKANVYDRIFKPAGFTNEQRTPAFIPEIDNLDENLILEGKLNAFNEFATLITDAYNAERQALQSSSFDAFLEKTEFVYEREEEFKQITKEVHEHTRAKPVCEQAPAVAQKQTPLSFMEWMDKTQTFEYMVFNQTASAIGNLILSQPENSRNPRNFLYQIFVQDYSGFVKGDTLFVPSLSSEELIKYTDKFFAIQALHRTYEKQKNQFSAKYKAYVLELEEKEAFLYSQATISRDANQASLTREFEYAFDMWMTRYKELDQKYTMLSSEKQQLLQQHDNQYKNAALEIQKRMQSDFFKLRVWLPEKARNVYDLIKQKGDA